MEHGKHTVLCVDDDSSILNSLKRLLRKEDYQLLTASGPSEGLLLLEKNRVSLVITDQRLPQGGGVDFLTAVREKYPDIIRTVLTGYTHIDTIMESVNKGHVYKFILKPWNDQNLIMDIRQCLEQYELIQANRHLHKKVMDQNEELTVINENLENLVNERTKDLEIHNKALELSRAILEEIPCPIIGLSEEMMVVYKNRQAQEIFGNNHVGIGSDISNAFPPDLVEKIRNAYSEGLVSVNNCRFYDKTFNIKISPLSDSFDGKGVVMTLEECCLC